MKLISLLFMVMLSLLVALDAIAQERYQFISTVSTIWTDYPYSGAPPGKRGIGWLSHTYVIDTTNGSLRYCNASFVADYKGQPVLNLTYANCYRIEYDEQIPSRSSGYLISSDMIKPPYGQQIGNPNIHRDGALMFWLVDSVTGDLQACHNFGNIGGKIHCIVPKIMN